MVELKPKSTNWNSLWSIMYCVLVLCLQGYISFQTIVHFQESLIDRWKNTFPSALSACLALTILSLILTPIFVITSIFKIGNYANDGFKLGRDHALCQIEDNFVDRFSSKSWRKLWNNFVPFSQTIHIIVAFLLLLPETIVESAEIRFGHKTSRVIWTSNIDFFFEENRPSFSDIMMKMNQSALQNVTSLTLVRQEPGSVSVQFVFFVISLLCFSVRYAAVFWYTNKALSAIFAFQLIFMSVESVFAYTGFSLLFKVSDNLGSTYYSSISLALGCPGATVLYFFGGFTILLSTMTTFYYGSQHFHEKFRLLDRKHNPEKYKGRKRKQKSIFNGYVSHTCAVGTWVLLTLFKGPVLYDLVTIYRKTSDRLVLSCVIIEISFLIFWIALWTLLTIKHKWLFRILDYANVGEPIFVIASNSLLSTPSMSIASIELKELKIPRGRNSSSHPSFDGMINENGNDVEIVPSNDENGIPLPAVRENPNADETGSIIIRRSRNRRSGNRVTFHERHRRSSAHSEGGLGMRRCASPLERTQASDAYYLESKRRSLPSHHRRSVSDLDRMRVSPRATPISHDVEFKVSNIHAALARPPPTKDSSTMCASNDKNVVVSPDSRSSKVEVGNNQNQEKNVRDSTTRIPLSEGENTSTPEIKLLNIKPVEESGENKYTIKGIKSPKKEDNNSNISSTGKNNDPEESQNDKDNNEISKYKQPDIVPKHRSH